MKATGIVRRIDELGRIVIPKEIRKQLKINEGQSLEIYMNDHQEIILKKYSEFSQLEQYGKAIMDTLYLQYGVHVLLASRDTIIYVASSRYKHYEGMELSQSMKTYIARRQKMEGQHFEILPLVREDMQTIIHPLNNHGELLGALFYLLDDSLNAEILNYSTALLLKALE